MRLVRLWFRDCYLIGCSGGLRQRRTLEHSNWDVPGGGHNSRSIAWSIPDRKNLESFHSDSVWGRIALLSLCLIPRQNSRCSHHRRESLATSLRLSGTYPTPTGPKRYYAQHVPIGFGIMFGAGTFSGLLGSAQERSKVLAMDQAMGLPFKVSITTSNFMIGVTAAASAGIYLSRGYIDAGIAMPVMFGVLLGSMIGSNSLPKLARNAESSLRSRHPFHSESR
jgi:hypothetical protein